MKSMLTAFAALTALALPAGLPTLAMAQDQEDFIAEPRPETDDNSRFAVSEVTASAPPAVFSEPQDRRVGRGGNRDGGGDRGGGDRGGDRGGNGGWNGGGDRGGDRGGNGGGDRGRDRNPADYGNSPDRWNRPNPPVVTPTPPTQDRGGRGRDNNGQDWNRGNDGRGNDGRGNGGWNGGGNPDRDRGSPGRDRPGQDWNRGDDGRGDNGRDRGGWNGGGNWNNGQNGGQNWNRDRNNGRWQSDRNGRRDYNGWGNRWNQNDWRRDWNRGRSSDWWRNDRGFRGYTGFRSGFYFAPNFGYYSVPRQYFGQRYYQGDYLPSIFWRYSLSDYRTFGLGYPPPGTQWVSVDNSIYLIDQFDGYIIEVIRDAWRW